MPTVRAKRKSQADCDGEVSHDVLERIGEYEADVSIRKLNHYHKNPRRGNVEKVAESLKSNGQFKPIVVNRGTLTGRPNEILAGNHCVDDQTEALTARGWVSGEELREDDTILSVDSTGQLRWSKVLGIFRNRDYSGLMHHWWNNRSMDALVSPGHKFLETNGCLTPIEELVGKNHRSIFTMGSSLEDGVHVYTDAFVELVGWAVTEGHYRIGKNARYVRISQLPGHYADRIEACLKSVGAKYQVGRSGRQGRVLSFNVSGELAKKIVDVSPKRIPSLDFLFSLSSYQRDLLVETMIDADGHRTATGGRYYTQKSVDHMDRFLILCSMSGIPTRTVTRIPPKTTGEYKFSQPYQVASLHKKRQLHVKKLHYEEVQYSGTIWCPTTEYGTWVCRRGGVVYVTGNTLKGARALGWSKLNVTWVDVDEDHARRIVLADNGSTDDATYDVELLSELLEIQQKEVGNLVGTTYSDDTLQKLLVEVDTDPLANIDSIADAPDELDGVADLGKYVFFESDADFDIPELKLDMIPERLPEKLDIWAGHEIDGNRAKDEDQWWISQWHTGNKGIPFERSILSLYTEDFHFEGLYSDPAMNTKKILNCGITCCISPNFSVNQDWPIYTWIWAAARSAYVARYWQEAGLLVIPDIQYGGSDEALDLCLQCIPAGAPVVAAQVQTLRGDPDRIRTTARLLKKAEEMIGFQQILIYGHTDADRVVQYAGLEAEVVRVENRTTRRREILDEGTTVKGRQVRSKRRTKGFEDGD